MGTTHISQYLQEVSMIMNRSYLNQAAHEHLIKDVRMYVGAVLLAKHK